MFEIKSITFFCVEWIKLNNKFLYYFTIFIINEKLINKNLHERVSICLYLSLNDADARKIYI